MQRTRAIEILTKEKAAFEVHEFHASEFTAEEAARELSIPEENVFKTLVLRSDAGDFLMAVVQGNRELSLKKLAHVAGKKKVSMVAVDELQKLTGYLKGGVSPFGSRKQMRIFVDQLALEREFISISAGLRGVQIYISPRQFVALSGATIGDISE